MPSPRSSTLLLASAATLFVAVGCNPGPSRTAPRKGKGTVTLRSGMRIKAGSRREYSRRDPRGNGRSQKIVEVRLAADWRDPRSGMVFKGGSLYKTESSGGIIEFTLAQPYREKRNRFLVGAGTPVTYYAKDAARSIPVGEDYLFKTGMSARAGTRILYHPNGRIRQLTLARNWKYNRRGLICKAGTQAEFNSKSQIVRCTPASDYIIKLPGTNMSMKCPANQELKF